MVFWLRDRQLGSDKTAAGTASARRNKSDRLRRRRLFAMQRIFVKRTGSSDTFDSERAPDDQLADRRGSTTRNIRFWSPCGLDCGLGPSAYDNRIALDDSESIFMCGGRSAVTASTASYYATGKLRAGIPEVSARGAESGWFGVPRDGWREVGHHSAIPLNGSLT
jgi:hypothetical protein